MHQVSYILIQHYNPCLVPEVFEHFAVALTVKPVWFKTFTESFLSFRVIPSV